MFDFGRFLGTSFTTIISFDFVPFEFSSLALFSVLFPRIQTHRITYTKRRKRIRKKRNSGEWHVPGMADSAIRLAICAHSWLSVQHFSFILQFFFSLSRHSVAHFFSLFFFLLSLFLFVLEPFQIPNDTLRECRVILIGPIDIYLLISFRVFFLFSPLSVCGPLFFIECRSGLRTLPNNAKMHYNYANVQKDDGRWETAIDHYRTAIE